VEKVRSAAATNPLGAAAEALPRPVLAGFDFPIGLPRAFASAAGVDLFEHWLTEVGHGRWSNFLEPSQSPSLGQPFYPMSTLPKGSTSGRTLADGLGLTFSELLRACEEGNDNRGNASSLFWLCGAQQVGRAAIHGWREVLQVASGSLDMGLWPFAGSLDQLLAQHEVVVVETYPREFYMPLGLPRSGWSKRRQGDRILRGAELHRWAESHEIKLSPEVGDQVADGFGGASFGGDAFDAFAGLLGMIGVVTGSLPGGEPPSTFSHARTVEGWWIFGRE
jgi:hypothetical protein